MDIRPDKKALDKLYRRRDRYDLQPDFQREPVWPEEKQQKLMDTILKGWDIPKFYLKVVDSENFECVDGQQRLTAIFNFFDNQFQLSKKLSVEYGGLYYSDLPDKIKDLFDDYELDLELIYEATEEEMRELFSRLQLGVPLNSAEKLNAMSGNMRNFVKRVSENKFFAERLPFKNKRYAFQAISAQICLLEIEGIRNAKFSDLEEFYKKNKDFNEDSTEGKKLLKVLDTLYNIFPTKTSVFKNRAAIISFYLLISELLTNNFDIDKNKDKLRNFYIDFQQKLKLEIEKGADAEDAELIVYQSKVNQAADSKDSILKRHEILKRRLLLFDSSFKSGIITSDTDKELLELHKKDSIKQLTDNSIELISEINKIYSSKNGVDLFKTTTDLLRGIRIISTPVNSKDEFKNLIDSLYKIFYEGSGTLNRIPENLVSDTSVFFDIKHLRTDHFHDYEHGKDKDIRDKKEKIASVYMKYTNKKSFDEIDEAMLIHFQRKLLENIENELIEIRKNI
ncbi:MAG: DUF262 domain-containing protein [Candidatus Aenigmatarchaeota archaeon]